MPFRYEQTYVEPEQILEHNGVSIYRVYDVHEGAIAQLDATTDWETGEMTHWLNGRVVSFEDFHDAAERKGYIPPPYVVRAECELRALKATIVGRGNHGNRQREYQEGLVN